MFFIYMLVNNGIQLIHILADFLSSIIESKVLKSPIISCNNFSEHNLHAI